MHLHRKFLNKKGVKMYSTEEAELWKTTVGKMNSHVRYLRRKQGDQVKRETEEQP